MARHWWLMPVILATQQAERDKEDQGSKSAQQILCETLSWKNPSQKRAGGEAQSVGSEFKPQY
jgi:hypothetical protein